MSYPTKAAAQASLREFTPSLRKAHVIVRFYSNAYREYRFARVLVTRQGKI